MTVRNRRSTAVLTSLVAFLLVWLPPTLHSQSVDYGALEQLFKEPVTTSVTGSPQRASDVPATMEIITAEDIRRSGAMDIPGVLRHVGGVDTLEWANDDIDVSVRGYDQAYSPRLLVLLNGRQLYADDYGYIPWSSVPVELKAIRQIELIKGPNSALFGFNAAGGVINIITYNPLYDKVNVVGGIGGTQGLGRGAFVGTANFGRRAGIRLSVGGNHNDDFATPIPLAAMLEPRKPQYRAAADLDVVIHLNNKTQLSIEGSESIAQQNEMLPNYQINDEHYNITSFKWNFVEENRAGLLQATVYTNWLKMDSNPGLLNEPLHPRNRVTVAQLEDVFTAGAHHILRAAVEYRHNTENVTPETGGHIFDDIFAVSGMWNWKITHSLSLTSALRIDHLALGRSGPAPAGYPFRNSDWDRSITQLSFNTGLVWKPRYSDSFRLTIARGAQLPSLILSGAYLQYTPYLKVTGTPFLNPSPVTNYEVGWDHLMPRSHILFRGSAFYQASADLLAVTGGIIVTPTGPYFVPANIGSSDARGVELGLKRVLPKSYRWSMDYRAEMISDHLIASAQHAAAVTDYQHTNPVHLVKANLGWANKRWEIDGYLHYQSQTEGLRPTYSSATLIPIGSFLSLDARIAYELTSRLTWAISGQNLTHASQIQTSGPAVERRILGTMSFHF